MACCRQALAIDPSDHNANLMGRPDGRTLFRTKGFEFAKQVSVVVTSDSGASRTFELRPSEGEWVGQIKLPKGKFYYSLHVDDTWTTDPDNGLAERRGKWYSSVLYVG